MKDGTFREAECLSEALRRMKRAILQHFENVETTARWSVGRIRIRIRVRIRLWTKGVD